MIRLHPTIIYPFGSDVFDRIGYEKYTLAYKESPPFMVKDLQNTGGPVVLFFMGNGGSLAYFEPILRFHRAEGRQIYALQYPGGGGVPGTPSETRLKLMALRAYDSVSAQTNGPILVHGISMGTGLAMHVGARRDVAGLVLDAPFARMCEVMTQKSLLPACYLPGVQKWDSLDNVSDLSSPVLVQHGNRDQLIPIQQSEKLFGALNSAGVPANFGILDGYGHNDLTSAPGYRAAINGFIAGLENKKAAP